jgi:pilus assembly protein FimV
VDLTAPAAAPPAAPAVPAAAAAPAELDFDLTLDGIDEQARPARDQLGGDLGLGFRDDAAAPRAEDASGLDLTLDGRHTPVPAARRAERPAADLDDTSGLDLTQGGETAPARPQPDAGVANARTVETTALEEEDLDFLNDADEAATKLDLARAYVDMGDVDGAREILGEVLNEGNDAQKRDAQELLARLK